MKVKVFDTSLNSQYLLPSCTGFIATDPGWITTVNSSSMTLSVGQWQLLISTYVWTDGHLYEIFLQADDGINIETNATLKSALFRYDTDKPRSSVAFLPPINIVTTVAYEKLSVISGTATDVTWGDIRDAGIDQAQMSKSLITETGCTHNPASHTFTGDAFHSAGHGKPAPTPSCMRRPSCGRTRPSRHNFTNGNTYNIQVRAIDRAG